MQNTRQNSLTEWSFTSSKTYGDPFHDATLDVVVTDPDGQELRVPAFWAGGKIWRVRYASAKTGRHRFRSECSDSSNAGLHGLQGDLEVQPYKGDNALLKHGALRATTTGRYRYLEHRDGTPFFWLADTWWMGLCQCLDFARGFKTLCADRAAKGFNVVQIVAGLYPDMPPFDPRGANEAGFPWKKDYGRINPAYFDKADRRIAWLVESGLLPCLVGSWGFFLPSMGVEKLKQHWRYLVARYGAYPVVWCVAGEATMPYYGTNDPKAWDAAYLAQKRGFSEVAAYLRQLDPYHHPITIHPPYRSGSRHQVNDPSSLDIEMLQCEPGLRAMQVAVDLVADAHNILPRRPVIIAEAGYEGQGGSSYADVQRFLFWTSVLSGNCGHTYGADGLFEISSKRQPYGESPMGGAWVNTPWEISYRFPGSQQLALAKKLLMRFPWWRFEPHPEWIEPCWRDDKPFYYGPFAAGIADEVRFVFRPLGAGSKARFLPSGTRWKAFHFNPITGQEHPAGIAKPDAYGQWPLPRPPLFQDWVLVMEKI